MTSQPPLVTIGLPTYNRPDGLLRALKQLTAQTHRHLRIVVSDNASPNPMVGAILARCAQLDPRIEVHTQSENVGLVRNFKYVQRMARSEYFMWAADDDEWDIRFVQACLEGFAQHDVGTVMPGFLRHNRALDRKGMARLPKMEGRDRFADAMAFYEAMPHSIFYGLHRRSTVEWFLDEDDALLDDEYFLIRQILQHGILTLPEQVLYLAGIDDARYQIKLPKAAPDRYFFQVPRLVQFATLVAGAGVLEDTQKLQLLQKIVQTKLGFVLNFEKELRAPEQYGLAVRLFHFLSQLDLRHIDVYAQVIANVNEQLRAREAAVPEATP